jgi:hypothetical protein
LSPDFAVFTEEQLLTYKNTTYRELDRASQRDSLDQSVGRPYTENKRISGRGALKNPLDMYEKNVPSPWDLVYHDPLFPLQ